MATICMHHVLASMHRVSSEKLVRERLLSAAGINPEVTQHVQRRVSAEQVARLFKQVQLTLGDEFMGFSRQLARSGAFQTMCELVKHCRTLGELLHKAVHFYQLLNDDVVMNITTMEGRAIFTIEHHSPAEDPDHFLREFLLVIWHRFPSWFIGEAIRLRETHFSFDVPKHRSELAVMFPGLLLFGQSVDCLIYDSHYLDKPLVRTESEVDFYALSAPADVMTIPGMDNSLERQVERLVDVPGGQPLVFPNIDVLVAQLGCSSQTLYRRLKASGTSYQKIKDDIRRERAIHCLVNEQMPVDKVSEMVGFSEARSFTRAFRQWTGMSPRRYRAMMLGKKAEATVKGGEL